MASSFGATNGPLRKSCDRCHAFKLRCNKTTDAGRCERCIRQNAACCYSPKELRRPAKKKRAPLENTASEISTSSTMLTPNFPVDFQQHLVSNQCEIGEYQLFQSLLCGLDFSRLIPGTSFARISRSMQHRYHIAIAATTLTAIRVISRLGRSPPKFKVVT